MVKATAGTSCNKGMHTAPIEHSTQPIFMILRQQAIAPRQMQDDDSAISEAGQLAVSCDVTALSTIELALIVKLVR